MHRERERGKGDLSAGSGGYLGEVTMVQLYGVALTAGKAHKDHKHHHAHRYEHETGNSSPRPTPPPPATPPPPPQHPFLTGRQINPQVKINPGTQVQIVQGGVTMRHPALVPRDPPPQPFALPNPDYSNSPAIPQQSSQFFGNLRPTGALPLDIGIADGTGNLQDGPYRNLFKREKNSLGSETASKELDSALGEAGSEESAIEKREAGSDDYVEEAADAKVSENEGTRGWTCVSNRPTYRQRSWPTKNPRARGATS